MIQLKVNGADQSFSGAPPADVGEPGVPPFVAAFYNAIFAATGTRVRDLPFTSLGFS